MDFDWNRAKARLNAIKHDGVTFEEATTVFNDSSVVIDPDYASSDDEDRFHALGFSERVRILLVVFTYRGENIRIISARKATAVERKHYDANQTY